MQGHFKRVGTIFLLALLVSFSWSVAAADGNKVDVKGVELPARAHSNYMLYCQGCHLPDGMGTPSTAPALQNHVSLFTSVPGGREYLVRVPGVATAPLKDGELAELLNWMLWKFDAPNLKKEFAPYTSSEVKELRKVPLRTEAEATRRSLLGSIKENTN